MQEEIFKAIPALFRPNDGDKSPRCRLTEVDENIWFQCYSLLEIVSDLVSNNYLYGLCKECSELDMFCFLMDYLPLVFDTLSKSATKALILVRPWRPLL